MNWRSIILTSLVCFSFSTVGAQTLSQEYINLCNEFFKDIRLWGYCGKLDCTTESDWYIKLEKSTYYNDIVSGFPPKDSIVFSPAELQYINDTLSKLILEEWGTDKILDSINFFSKQHIDSIAEIEEKNNPYGMKGRRNSFYNHFICHRLFKISHPVFLRNNTVCIFSWGIEDPYGDSQLIRIYVKTEGRWKDFNELFASIGG